MLTAKSNWRTDIIPLNFKKAIIEPEKVIAPTAAPIDISMRLANLISPKNPKPKASGFKKAATATKTAAKPTKHEIWLPTLALQSSEF